MDTPRKLIVIGGTAAGLSAASKAKRLNRTLEVTVFERSGYISYGACGLPYFLSGMIEDHTSLIAVTAEEMTMKRGITVHTHTEITSIDRNTKAVTAKNLTNGKESKYYYDDLMIATGAEAIIPPIKGADLKNVHVLRNIEDGIAIRNALKVAKKACIIGGGVIGLEVAEQLIETGLTVTLIEAMSSLLPTLPLPYSTKIYEEIQNHGGDVYLDTRLEELLGVEGRVHAVKTNNGDLIECDLVIIAVGVRPATDLARKSGLELGVKGSIVVDEFQRTSDPSIWAAGDCTQMKHLLTGKPYYAPLGTTANKGGRVAGSNIGGEAAKFPGVLGSLVTKIFNLYVATTGLSLTEAIAAGFDAVEQSIIKDDKASYYPGGKPTYLTLVFEKHGGRILGAQGVGPESVSGRINLLVSAITMGMTVFQLNDLDLLYTPSVAPVYDPILIAAAQAIKQVEDVQ